MLFSRSPRSLTVHLLRGQIIERLVRPLLIIEVEVTSNALSSVSDTVILSEIDLFILERAPEPFGKDIVHTPSPTVHADSDPLAFEQVREGGAGKLGALVGIEDAGDAGHTRLLQGRQTEPRLHRDRGLPGKHIPAEPVHDGHQVEPAAVQPDVRDIRRPHLIRVGDDEASQQIRVDRMLRPGPAQMRLRINRLQTHLPHQSLHMLPVDRIPPFLQDGLHLPGPVEGRLGVLFVDQAHEHQIIGIDHRCIVDAGAGDTQKLRLATDGQLTRRLINERNLLPMG